MTNVEYDGLIGDSHTHPQKRPFVTVAFRTDRFGVVQVDCEPLERTPELDKSMEEIDVKLRTSLNEPNLNMFAEEDRHYIKKWCTAMWICVFAAGMISGQRVK